MSDSIKRQFIEIPLSPGSIPFYIPRRSIFSALSAASSHFTGIALDVGCGYSPYKSFLLEKTQVSRYIGLDLQSSDLYSSHANPDLTWDGRTIPLENDAVDCVIATEFLEHHDETTAVLSEMFRVLKPDGVFFATVPFIWNLHELPHDEYRFTPSSLERHARLAGFDDIEVKALGGWNRSLAQMLGLWLGFSPMNKLTRIIMRVLCFPLYALLIKTDKIPNGFDGAEKSMFTGLSLLARKNS